MEAVIQVMFSHPTRNWITSGFHLNRSRVDVRLKQIYHVSMLAYRLSGVIVNYFKYDILLHVDSNIIEQSNL